MREERRHGADTLLAVLRAQRERTTMTAGLAALHAALAPLQAAMRGRRARRERKEAARAATTVASGYRGRRARLTAGGRRRAIEEQRAIAERERRAMAALSPRSRALAVELRYRAAARIQLGWRAHCARLQQEREYAAQVIADPAERTAELRHERELRDMAEQRVAELLADVQARALSLRHTLRSAPLSLDPPPHSRSRAPRWIL